MGTEKRERQKANRAQRREYEARSQRNSRVRRTALQWGIGIAAAFGAVLLIAYFTGALGSNDETATSTPPTVAPLDTVPTETLPAATTAPADTGTTTETSTGGSTVPATPAECPAADGSSPKTMQFGVAQQMCIDPAKTYTAEIVTNKGTVVAELFADKAPLTVNNFVTLARYHYFDGISCHRIINGFMAQCGDPTGSGSGGPGYEFDDELPETGEYQIGSLAMANAGPNTNGSQFFIITGPQGVALPPDYSLFGQVTEGLDDTVPALDAAGSAKGVPPSEPVTIESITITES